MPVFQAAEHRKALESPDFDLISGPAQAALLRRRVEELSGLGTVLGVDTETTGLDPHEDQVRLIQVASADFAVLVDLDGWRHPGERQVDWSKPGLRELKAWLESAAPKVLQNAAFDLGFLLGEGIALGGPLFDTMIAAKVCNNGTGHKNDLGSIVERNLKVALDKELQKADWSGELTSEMLRYAARDGIALPRLVPILTHALRTAEVKEGTYLWDIFRLEMECLRPFALMQWHGFGFDVEAAEQLKVQLTAEADVLLLKFLTELDGDIRRRHPENEAIWLPRDPDGSFNTREKDSGSVRLGTKKFKGFNPRSPKQMAERFEQAGILLPPDSKGVPSLDQNLLAFLRKDYPLVDEYLTWKHAITRVSHVEKLLESVGPDGRIHSRYKQMGTDTGRVSCAEPNTQQIPRTKDFRSLFVAAPGCALVVADFSQVELRVAAELSGEERMREAYRANRDLHTETAALVTGKEVDLVTKEERTSAKVCFSLDTEVLTPAGWIALQDYRGEPVAQYTLPSYVELNPACRKRGTGSLPPWRGHDGTIEFVNPLHYETMWSNDVWHAVGAKYDIMATGRHNIFYLDACGRALLRPLLDVKWPHHFVTAGWLKDSSVLSSAESRFLAAAVADGCFKSRPTALQFNFVKQRKITRLRTLLLELCLPFTEAEYQYGSAAAVTRFSVPLEAVRWLLHYTTVDKELIAESCLRGVDKIAYLDEAQYWDGYKDLRRGRQVISVTTTVRKTADITQALAVLSGLPCSIHTAAREGRRLRYTVSYFLNKRPVCSPRLTWKPKPVDPQPVSCVQVPSGLLVIRRSGKTTVQGNCNFGLLYGAGAATLRKQAIAQYGVNMSDEEAKALVNGFRTAYPRLKQWQETEGNRTTKAVFTKLGRRRILVGFNDKYTTRINTQIQGTSGDIAKQAISLLWQELQGVPENDAKLIAMVHDEIVMEVRADLAEQWAKTLSGVMEAAGNSICEHVPIVAEASIGATWAEAK